MPEQTKSPSPKSNFWNVVIVLLFGSAMVALGVQEIHERYGSKTYASRESGEALVQDFYGETEVNRASLSPEAVEQIKERQRQASKRETITFKEFFAQFFPK